MGSVPGEVFEETTTYKRQQQRRGIIAWGTGLVFTALVVLSLAFGPGDQSAEVARPLAYEYSMTSDQYDSLVVGVTQADFFAQIQRPGLPEEDVKTQYTALFPSPEAGTTCLFWQISDHFEELARICFDEDELLAQKLERSASEEEFGVSV